MVSMKRIIYKTPMKKTKKFKVGDLVRVSDKTHDSQMPNNRLGHIIGKYDAGVAVGRSGAWELYMTNGSTLVFHEMFLEHVND